VPGLQNCNLDLRSQISASDSASPCSLSSGQGAALPKSAHPGAKKALAEIYNAENKEQATKAAKAFVAEYGAKWPKAAAKITEDLDVLLAFYLA